MIAKVAVSDCVYAIDRPYSYRIPAQMQVKPGMRVLVPFGNGNRKKEAVVLATGEGEEEKLKTVEQVLDETPVLTAAQLQLAAFLRERYFCTYYDAVKAILPAGLWFRRQEMFALTPEALAYAESRGRKAQESVEGGGWDAQVCRTDGSLEAQESTEGGSRDAQVCGTDGSLEAQESTEGGGWDARVCGEDRSLEAQECAEGGGREVQMCGTGGSLEAEIVQFLRDMGGSATDKALRQRFPEEQALTRALKSLKAKKLLLSSLDLMQRGKTKTQKMVRLAVPAEDALDFARRKQRSAPLQAAVLQLLCAVGSGSAQEVCTLTGASLPTLRRLEKLGLLQLTQQDVFRPAYQVAEEAAPLALNEEQSAAAEGLWAQAQKEKPGAALLYGVTGSGKTAVYLELIARTLAAGKSAVLLVPEIALTPQLLGKLTGRFGRQVAVLHSSLQVGARFDEWRRIREGQANVVVGTRSAVFAPVENPGLFILDEEQEHTYKSENTPRYHAREVALYRGMKAGALVVLGSATPSVETMYHAKRGLIALFTLRSRFNRQALPQVELVDLKQELRAGNAGTVSTALEERLRDVLLDGKQAILFLNRRGNSRCLICVDCGDAPSCPRCSAYLTYHSVTQRLMCHYCGYSEPVTERCPHCGGALRPVGAGTQKVEEELRHVFPDTKILRMDADTVSASGSHEKILDAFRQRKASILLGTQMVAKGLDFESVTLAGVLDADLSLYVNHYRAAETTFSLITQLVGRSGRGTAAGTAVIQTMSPEHPVLRLAAAQDYDGFYELEIGLRELRGVPPFQDLLTVTFTGLFEEHVRAAAKRFREALAMNLKSSPYAGMDFEILGPAPALVAKVNYTYRYRLTLRCKNSRQIRALLSFLLGVFAKDKQNKGVNAFVDINAYD